MSSTLPTSSQSWPDYRAVWRWHFYASLFCIPFVIILAISGAIYLFKPQIEAWNDWPYDHLTLAGTPASAADQVRAALAGVPGASFSSYELPPVPNAAARVIVRQGSESIRVYLHPESLQVLHTVRDNQRFMRVMFRLHGELWMGDRGSNLVELAASWTIIMIVTGLYLWWPRDATGWGGIVYPRLRKGTHIFWRDVHSVTGVWISALALLLLMSGLPWAKFWGNYFKSVRHITGTAVAQQDWTTGSDRSSGSKASGSGEHGSHGGSSRRSREAPPPPRNLAALDRIVAAVQPLGLPHPVVIAPPAKGSSDWTVKSLTANRPQRVNLVVSETGQIVSREGFQEKHWLDRIVAVGIAAHEGQLFGWPNQLLGLCTALGLVLLCISGLVMWWRRRDQGVLGAPKVLLSPRISWGLIALVVLFGIYLPLFGASLLVVLAAERLLLCRIPRVRDWLGLYVPSSLPKSAVLLLAILVALSQGCGPSPVAGGTKGTLRAAGDLLAEVQVTVHQAEAGIWQPIGFAVTAGDGSFELVTSGAKGPLWLSPGEYRCTLESAGAPVQIPQAYAAADTTPLQVVWSASDQELNLEVPVKLLR